MSDNIQIHLSRRGRELLAKKSFALNPTPEAEIHWEIEYSGSSTQLQTDRILTLRYSHPTGIDLTDLFLESFCRLCQGKMVQAVFSFSFREVESFLRDENHVPAFADLIESEAKDAFSQVKSVLVQSILLGNVDLKKELGPEIPWKKLTVAGKNRALMAFIAWLNSRVGTSNPLELILAEKDTVTVKNNDFPLELPVVEGMLNQLFQAEELDSPLKVIGTL